MRENPVKKNFYLSLSDDKKLKDKCHILDVNETEFFRNLINDIEVDYKLRKEILDILYELRKIGTNINQIAHIANSTNQIMENKYETNYKELMTIIEELREKLR